MASYRLLSGVTKTHASLMVALVLVSAAIAFLNEVNNIAALTLFRGGDFLAVFDKGQLDALAMLFLRLHGQGLVIDQIFWGAAPLYGLGEIGIIGWLLIKGAREDAA